MLNKKILSWEMQESFVPFFSHVSLSIQLIYHTTTLTYIWVGFPRTGILAGCLLKLFSPPATFEIFSVEEIENGNLSKVARGKFNFDQFFILLRSFQGVFWKENVQGYLHLDSIFAFHSLICVWECIKDQQKNTILPSSHIQGLFWTS